MKRGEKIEKGKQKDKINKKAWKKLNKKGREKNDGTTKTQVNINICRTQGPAPDPNTHPQEHVHPTPPPPSITLITVASLGARPHDPPDGQGH